MSANLRNYVKTIYALDAVVQRTPTEAWDKQSPCDAWTAREVLGHFMWGAQRLTAAASGDATPPEKAEAEVAGTDPKSNWAITRDALLAALDHQGALDRHFDGPFGPGRIDDFLGIHTTDGLLHAWDIAKTAGIDSHIPEDLAAACAAGLASFGDGIRRPGLFDAAVAVPESADPVTKFVAIAGRNPL